MRLGELFALAGIEVPAEARNVEISRECRIVTDSRKACDGCIFVAVRGYNTDGHKYIDEAIEKGAAVIVAEQVRDGCVGGAAIIKVENTRRVAALLCNAQCGFPSKKLKVVGVTGTNGKTSVCFMLESVFMAAGISCAVIGTLGYRINGKNFELGHEGLTTPDATQLYPLLALFAHRGVKYVFMEISSHAIALERVSGLELEYGVFTNLTRDHLDFHGTMEKYFLTKASLFEQCRKKIINVDCPYGKRLYGMYRGSIAVSRNEGDFVMKELTFDSDGCRYGLTYENDKKINISIKALGDFSAFNSALTAALALDAKISPSHVIGGLSPFLGVEGRMERVDTGSSGIAVIVDYAHTPDALESLLKNVRAIFGSNSGIILVFGCGGDRDVGKRKQMGQIASRLSDTVIISSDNSRSESPDKIFSDILKGIDKEMPRKLVPDRAAAIEYAVELARENDVIVLAGKGHEKYEIDAEGKHYFNEREIVRTALAKKSNDDI